MMNERKNAEVLGRGFYPELEDTSAQPGAAGAQGRAD